MPLSRLSGTVDPDHLDMLWRVLERVCVEARIEKGTVEHEAIAIQLMICFQQGIRDEQRLFEAVIERVQAPQRSYRRG